MFLSASSAFIRGTDWLWFFDPNALHEFVLPVRNEVRLLRCEVSGFDLHFTIPRHQRLAQLSRNEVRQDVSSWSKIGEIRGAVSIRHHGLRCGRLLEQRLQSTLTIAIETIAQVRSEVRSQPLPRRLVVLIFFLTRSERGSELGHGFRPNHKLLIDAATVD